MGITVPNTDPTFKVAERFYSIQGEGQWAGVPMAFLRLSQCPVGGPDGICTSWDGKQFVCDTGKSYKPTGKTEFHPYNEVREQMSVEQVHDWVRSLGAGHLCVTGGEPLIYPVEELISDHYMVHIETSGTVLRPELVISRLQDKNVWITLSPKLGWKPEMVLLCDEIKLLVDRNTTYSDIKQWKSYGKTLSLQPIDEPNDEKRQLNIDHAISLCQDHQLRLSVQTHKYIFVR